MQPITREEFVEALKVPTIMGRGPAYGVVVGDRRMVELYRADQRRDDAHKVLQPDGSAFGMRVLVTMLYSNTFFAVTKEELDEVLERLEKESQERTGDCNA